MPTLYLSSDRRKREELSAVIQAVSVYTGAEPAREAPQVDTTR
jgi:hypothetical protein